MAGETPSGPKLGPRERDLFKIATPGPEDPEIFDVTIQPLPEGDSQDATGLQPESQPTQSPHAYIMGQTDQEVTALSDTRKKLLAQIAGLSIKAVKPPRRSLEYKGPEIPGLILALIRTHRRDIADLFRQYDTRMFKEALRLLTVIVEDGRDNEIIDKINQVLNREPPESARSSTSPASTAPKEKGQQSPEEPTPPAILGLDPKIPQVEVVLPVSKGGPAGIISPEMEKMNPWRDDLLIRNSFTDLEIGHMAKHGKLDPRFPVQYQLRYASPEETKVGPHKVVNRMGGKEEVMHEYDDEEEPLLPRVRLETWVDGFGASLASTGHAVRTGRIGPETDIIINEIHPELFNVHKAIRMDVEKLITILGEMKAKCSSAYYKQLVAEFNREQDLKNGHAVDPIYRAARYMFLLGTCILSNLRQNTTTGHINVNPRNTVDGKRKPKIFDAENLRMMSLVLQNATLINGNFDQTLRFMGGKLDPAIILDKKDIIEKPQRSDRKKTVQAYASRILVFLDSPYIGQETTVEYGVPPFRFRDHKALAQMFKTLSERGVMVMETNSDTMITRDLYRKSAKAIIRVKVQDKMGHGRAKGTTAKGKRSRKRNEVCIISYKMPWMDRKKKKAQQVDLPLAPEKPKPPQSPPPLPPGTFI